MNLYVMPISGSYFPHQLAMLEWLAEAGAAPPSLVLGSSGGNIAAYVGMAGSWAKQGMRVLYTELYARDVWQSWWPVYLPLPSILKGYFKGSMYRMNPKFKSVYRRWFPTPESAMQTEIWTGTFNKTRGMSHIFCNRDQASSQLQPLRVTQAVHMNRNLNTQDVTYMAGDLDRIYTVSLASAAVPAVFPSQVIDMEDHNDGGSSFSSPLTPLQDVVRQFLKGFESYHITYLSSYNILTSPESVCQLDDKMRWDTSIYHQGMDAMYEVLKSLQIQDRKCAIELTCLGRPHAICHYEELTVDSVDALRALQERRSTYERTLLELYPLSGQSVPLVSFRPYDIITLIDDTAGFGCRLWYFDPNDTSPATHQLSSVPVSPVIPNVPYCSECKTPPVP